MQSLKIRKILPYLLPLIILILFFGPLNRTPEVPENPITIIDFTIHHTRRFFLLEIVVLFFLFMAACALACYYSGKSPRILLQSARLKIGRLSFNQKAIAGIFAAASGLTLLGMLLGDRGVFLSTFWADRYDAFMDLYNPMYSMQNGSIPLHDFYNENTGGYPPLARFILWAIGNTLPRNLIEAGAKECRIQSVMLFVLIVIGLLMAVFAIISIMKCRHKWLIYLCIVFSAPMVYAIERGNLLLIAFVLALFFTAEFESESKLKRDAAYLALALSAGIKVYPAVYGFLLVSKRKWKEAFQLACVGLSVFLFPFLFTGGFGSFVKFIQNLGSFVTGANNSCDPYWLINYRNVLNGISIRLNIPSFPASAVHASLLMLVALLIASALISDRYWKQSLALTLVLILFPGANVYYSAIFYCIPLLLAFRDEEKDRSILSRLLVVCLALSLAPLQFLCGTYGFTQADTQFFCGLLGLVMAGLLVLDGCICLCRKIKNAHARHQKKPSVQ